LAFGIIAAGNPKASKQFVESVCDYPQDAKKDGPIGRPVAAIANKRHNRCHQESPGISGFFECANDHAVADALPGRAKRRVFHRGATFLRGPENSSTDYECGMMNTYIPAGSDGVIVRPIDMKNCDAQRVRGVNNSARERKRGFDPAPNEPARQKLLAAGFIKILYYQRLVKNAQVFALGVVEEYRASGLAAGLQAALVRNRQKLGYGDCEMSWILEDNVLMNRSREAMGAKRYKTYRLNEWN